VLWVFSPANPSSAPFEPYYPGDAFVDVVAFDRYDSGGGTFGPLFTEDLRVVGDFAKRRRKVAAIAEVGANLTDLDPFETERWFTQSLGVSIARRGRSFAYVALWRNAPWEKFVPESDDGEIAGDFVRFARDPFVLVGGVHNLYAPLHVR
jgi:hypothetical protein